MRSLAVLAVLWVGAALADPPSVSFWQHRVSVASVVGGTVYGISGDVPVKNEWVGLCVEVGGGYHCQQVLTDANGHFATDSDIDSCNFEISPESLTCDKSPKTLNFAIWKWGQGSRILTTQPLVVE